MVCNSWDHCGLHGASANGCKEHKKDMEFWINPIDTKVICRLLWFLQIQHQNTANTIGETLVLNGDFLSMQLKQAHKIVGNGTDSSKLSGQFSTFKCADFSCVLGLSLFCITVSPVTLAVNLHLHLSLQNKIKLCFFVNHRHVWRIIRQSNAKGKSVCNWQLENNCLKFGHRAIKNDMQTS